MENPSRSLAGTPAAPDSAVSAHGTLAHYVAKDLFSNSIHFPLANIILELLHQGRGVFAEPGIYALLFGGLIQAWCLGRWEFNKQPRPLVGNLIGPAVYTLIEFLFEGGDFFSGINHWAYWGFSLAIGLSASLSLRLPGLAGEFFLVLENMARTAIMLAMYWIFEVLSHPENVQPAVFFADASHLFFATVVLLLGVIIGFERVNTKRRQTQVDALTTRLGEYSEWLLGRDLLRQALAEPDSFLNLKRRHRHMLFMDIRGFTAWSELHSPEEVVGMLNRYFAISEEVWHRFSSIKAKYTGDEVMAVFSHAGDAAGAAFAFQQALAELLAETGLAVGIGIHCGPLMEGALGSSKVKAYDVIGDTVNTAKRLCDNAVPGEVLISGDVLTELQAAEAPPFSLGPTREIKAKGKREPIEVHPLLPAA